MDPRIDDRNIVTDRSLDLGIGFREINPAEPGCPPEQAMVIKLLKYRKIIKYEDITGISSGKHENEYIILFKNHVTRNRVKTKIHGNKNIYTGLEVITFDMPNIVKENLTYVHLYNIPMQWPDSTVREHLSKHIGNIKRIWRGKLKEIPTIENGVRHLTYVTPDSGFPTFIPHHVYIFGERIRVTYRGQPPIIKLCFNCGRNGHYVSNCTKPLSCLKCGGLDHVQNKCQDPYQGYGPLVRKDEDEEDEGKKGPDSESAPDKNKVKEAPEAPKTDQLDPNVDEVHHANTDPLGLMDMSITSSNTNKTEKSEETENTNSGDDSFITDVGPLNDSAITYAQKAASPVSPRGQSTPKRKKLNFTRSPRPQQNALPSKSPKILQRVKEWEANTIALPIKSTGSEALNKLFPHPNP